MSSFINLDLSILLSSQSNQVFQEMVDLYPGASRVQEVICQYECSCSDPTTCARKAFQLVLGQASNGDKDIAAKFIEEAADQCNTFHEVRELMVKYYDKIVKVNTAEGEDYQIIEVSSEDAARSLGSLLGGRPLE